MAVVLNRYAELSQVKMFYREAGDPSNPTILLLHGFPTSSHMFRGLIPLLACLLHVVAPDLPGFGYTESTAANFDYTFDNLSNSVEELIQHLGITHYFVYIMDYGDPTGLRLVEAHPERILGLVVQNGNAYEAVFGEFLGLFRYYPFLLETIRYWKNPTPETEKPVRSLLTFETKRSQYVTGSKDVDKISPDNWYFDYMFLQLPGRDQIQVDLFYDYQYNLGRYPGFQAVFRKHQFPTLIVWGKNDVIFGVEGAKAFLRDLPHAKLYLLNGGHFILEDHLKQVADYILHFAKQVKS